MLQQCTKQSETPYYIQAIDLNVYSLEEINYFIYNHMNLVYREFFCADLFDYIEKELEQKELADALRALDGANATIQDFIKCILKNSGYYNGQDLSEISELVMNINNLGKAERKVIEAESNIKKKQYGTALRIYFDILNDMEKDRMSGAFYAKIAFSIGIIYARLFMSRNANSYFAYAYELYPDPAYAKACVYMSIVNGDDEELLRTIIKYKVSDDALDMIKKRVADARRKIEDSQELADFMEDARHGRGYENVVANWKKEYYTILG